jgi:hypothetical protein
MSGRAQQLGDIEALKAWAISHSTIPEMSDVFQLCQRFDALLEANAQLLALESSLQIRVAELEAENAQLRSPASNPTWPNGERRRGYPAYEPPPADPELYDWPKGQPKPLPARPQER